MSAAKAYRYYDLILGAYVCVVLCANLIGAAKVATVHVPGWVPVTFMAGVLFFLVVEAEKVILRMWGSSRAAPVTA